MLQNNEIYLRPVEPEDLDLLYEVENDPSVWWIGGQNGPYSKFMLRQFIADATGDIYTDKQIRFVAVLKQNNTPVGFIDLFDFSPTHRRAEVGILVLKDYRNNGYASKMLNLIEGFAAQHLMIHQLYAYTPVVNTPAVSLFRKGGFTEEHVLKDWVLLNNGFSDAFLFQKTVEILKK